MDFIGSITSELQYVRDIILGDFKTGGNYPVYSNATAYNAGDRVRLENKAIYERRYIDDVGAVIGTTTGIDPTGAALSAQTWIKLNDNYIGIDERKKYNGQLIVLTQAINNWFGVTSAPYFWIDNNNAAGIGFALWCPNAVFLTLGPTTIDRENVVREFINRYAIAGIVYDVLTY